KGIAHKNVRDQVPADQLEELEKPLAAYVRQIPESYRAGLRRAEQREAEAAARRKAEIEAEAQRLAADLVRRQMASAPAAAPQAAPASAAPQAVSASAAPQAAAAAGPGGPDWSSIPAKT